MQSGIYSHPNVLLEEHINNVLSIYRLLKNELLPFWNEEILTTLEVAIALHDVGKATEYFQRKLKGDKLKPTEGEYSKHSFLSAVYTFYVLHKRFYKEFSIPIGFLFGRKSQRGVLKAFKDSYRSKLLNLNPFRENHSKTLAVF